MSSPSTTLQEARRLQLIATGSIVGLAFFSATALLLPLVSEYSFTSDYISELAIGRYGYLQTASFFVVGGSSLALAVGIRETTKGSWGSRVGSAFFGLYGLGGVFVGIFPTDEVDATGRVVSPTSVGSVHMVVSALAFVLGIVGMFVLSRTFKRDARWQAFWPWSLVLAVIALVGFFLQSELPWVGFKSAGLRRDDHIVAGARGIPAPLDRQSRIGRATSAGALGVRTSENFPSTHFDE